MKSTHEIGKMPSFSTRDKSLPMSAMRIFITTLVLTGVLAGCSLKMPKLGIPRVHKITVQQGNVITQEMINQLKPGMTHSQVAYIMGEPIFRNAFNDARWDYIYTVETPGIYSDERRLSLYFEDDMLAYFTGDYAPKAAQDSGVAAQDDGAMASQDGSEAYPAEPSDEA